MAQADFDRMGAAFNRKCRQSADAAALQGIERDRVFIGAGWGNEVQSQCRRLAAGEHAVSFSGPSGEEHVMVAPRELLAGFGLDTQADQAMALVSTKTEIVRPRTLLPCRA